MLDSYEVFDAQEEDGQPWLSLFHEALSDFESAHFARASAGFTQVDELRQGDGLSQRYLTHCQRLEHSGVPEGWVPVFDTSK